MPCFSHTSFGKPLSILDKWAIENKLRNKHVPDTTSSMTSYHEKDDYYKRELQARKVTMEIERAQLAAEADRMLNSVNDMVNRSSKSPYSNDEAYPSSSKIDEVCKGASSGGNNRNAWIDDVETGVKHSFTMTTITSLESMTADGARGFLNGREAVFKQRATYFSRTCYGLGLLSAKAHWGVGATISTIGFVGGEMYGDIANRYDSVESLIKSIHSDGVYIKTIDRTTFSLFRTVSSKSIQVYTYDGQLIGELGY